MRSTSCDLAEGFRGFLRPLDLPSLLKQRGRVPAFFPYVVGAAVRRAIWLVNRAPIVCALLHVKKQIGVLCQYRSGSRHEHYKPKTGAPENMTKRPSGMSRTCGGEANKHVFSVV